EYTLTAGTRMSVSQIIDKVQDPACRLVQSTGGEPLLQHAVQARASQLADLGHTLLIETGGHRDISKLDPRVVRIMDLKCPDSGEATKNLWSNLDHLREVDEVKFVIASRIDYEWARQVIREHKLDERGHDLFSTADSR